MVLFASNIMDPLTVGSFLLILMQPNNTKYQRSKNCSIFKVKKKNEMQAKQILTCTPFSQWLGPKSPTARSISSAVIMHTT